MLLDAQAAFSVSLMGRDASEMSVSPPQNFSKPPPVPEVPTVTWTPEFCCWNMSAADSLSGATVLEPSMLMAPIRRPTTCRCCLHHRRPRSAQEPEAGSAPARAPGTGAPLLDVSF